MRTPEELQKIAIDLMEKQVYNREPLTLYEPIDYGMHQGGKRVRPLLCLIANEVCGGELEKAFPAAVAVEMLHNFTLLHDDIMDKSPLRRGKPTVYQKYNTNRAILSGDTMFACSYNHLLQCDKNIVPNLVEIMTRGAIEVCEGQAYDIDFETRNDVSLEEYIEMIRLKTGVLLATALKLGAVTAGASADTLSLLDTFGHYIGIAFQIQDDIFDCWSDVEVFGKVSGTDIADRKKTFLYLKALELAKDNLKENLRELYCSTDIPQETKTTKVKEIYEELNVRTAAREAMEEYNRLALQALEQMNVPNERKRLLVAFAEKLINRNK